MLPTAGSTDILAILRLEDFPPAEQAELLLDMSDLVFRSAMVRIVERMDDRTRIDFNQLMDQEPEEELVSAFLLERVRGADNAVAEAIQEFSDDILALTSTNE